MSKILDDNYFQVTGWMLNRLKLKGIALNVYAIIYGFSQDGESSFNGSRQYLCDFTGATKPTIDKALSELREMNLIIKTSKRINEVIHNEYKANLEVLKGFTTCKETLPPDKNSLQGGSKETLPNNELLYIKIIIDYLNSATSSNYRYQSKATQRLIKARLNDGFTVADFKEVIDKKVKEWKGTEMEKYIRPETLFGTKFESYLNQKKVVAKQTKYAFDYMQREYSEKELAAIFTNSTNFDGSDIE